MSMKDDFLDEIHVGDYVIIYYGAQLSATGKVLKLTNSSVCIETENGYPRISLDSIFSYDMPLQSQEGKDAEIKISAVLESRMEVVEERLESDNIAAYLHNAVPLNMECVADWNNRKKLFEDPDLPRELRNEIRGIISSFSNIMKSIPTSSKVLDDKMHNISAKVLRTAMQYEDMQDELYGLLAAMYLQLRENKKAAEYFLKAHEYLELIYAGGCDCSLNQQDVYLDSYISVPNRLDPYLYSLYIKSAMRRKNVLALGRRVQILQENTQFDDLDIQELEYLSACVWNIAKDEGFALQTKIPTDPTSILQYLVSFFNGLPENWNCIDIMADINHKETKQLRETDQQRYTSTIKYFNSSKLFGFINASQKDYFFYIEQVNKDDVLRKVLAYDHMSDNLEVTFQLGKPYNPTKHLAAYDIMLTPRGATEATRRLERAEKQNTFGEPIVYGILEEYQHDNGFGRIYIGGNAYGFIEKEIIDPHLLGHLTLSYTDTYQIPVAFFAKKDNKGKNIALKVHCGENPIKLSQSDIQSLIRRKILRQEDFDLWPTKKHQLENLTDNANEIENLYHYPYIPLEPIDKHTQHGVTLAEEPSASMVRSVLHTKSQFSTYEHLPPLEDLPPIKNNQFAHLQPLKGQFYERAHSSLLKGRLVEAEQLYINAIRAGDRLESAIADLVMVFLRSNDRMTDAIKLMEAYGNHLTYDKRTNLLLQIYQKSHDRPYRIKLCYLLEDVIAQPIRINAKLHYLSLQGSTLKNLGEFRMALNSYRRWHQLYDSEVQYRGQSAITQFAGALNYIKRGEAICYYWQDDRKKAEELARELLRISSNDETAQLILSGTLQKTFGEATETMEDQTPFMLFSEEEVVLGGIELSGFANARLKDLTLSKYMKSYALKGDEYTGEPNQAKADIKFLLAKQGQTPAIKSDWQLCAAKIIVYVQERYGDNKAWQKYLYDNKLTDMDAKKHMARSMAAYGDAILAEQQETDTARYAYLQAIGMLPMNETDWKKSVNHYIQSYFYGKRDMASLVTENNRATQQKGVDLSIIRSKQSHDINEFVIGVLKLRKILQQSKNSDWYGQLDDVLYNSNMVDSLVEWFHQHDILTEGTDSEQLAKALDQAEKESENVENNLAELIQQLPHCIMLSIRSERLLEALKARRIQDWLGYSDGNRLLQICRILDDFRSYFTNRDFQNRSGRFENAIKQIVELTQQIKSYPTNLSYDVFLPALESTRAQLLEAQEQHYVSLPPDIRIEFTEGVHPYLNNNEIRVHLTIYNGSAQRDGSNRQLADNIKIEVLNLGSGIEYIPAETDVLGHIYGGKSLETILTFRIMDQQVLSLGTFDWSVKCTYRYNALPTETKNSEVFFCEPVVFQRGHHAKIPNPFISHIGKEMSDDEMFKGREGIIQDLVDTIQVNGMFNYGHGILLYGQTRAGKSSIRIHFVERVRKFFPGIILADMKNLGGGLTEPAFYILFLDVLQDELHARHADVVQQLKSREIEIPSEKILNNPNFAQTLFARFMKRMCDVIKSMDKMVLLVADEFSEVNTAIKERRMPEDFMKTWKAMLENYGVFAVCFGQDDTPQFAQMNQNAFARMDQKKVTYLAMEPAKELIDNPIAISMPDGTLKSRYTPDALDELYDLTAGSAFLILKLCALLVDYLNEKGAENVTPGILRDFLNNSVFKGNNCITEGDFEPQLGDRSDETLKEINQMVLLDIAQNSQRNGWAEIQNLCLENIESKGGQTSKRRLDELLNRLQERDVIEIEENQRCRIKVSLLSEWLLFKYGRK